MPRASFDKNRLRCNIGMIGHLYGTLIPVDQISSFYVAKLAIKHLQHNENNSGLPNKILEHIGSFLDMKKLNSHGFGTGLIHSGLKRLQTKDKFNKDIVVIDSEENILRRINDNDIPLANVSRDWQEKVARTQIQTTQQSNIRR